MGQPVVHFEIMGADAIKLQKFYAELFQWDISEPVAAQGNYARVDERSSGLGGGIGEQPDGTKRTTVYVQVPDVQATLDNAVKLGGTVAVPPMEIPGVTTFAQFADPEGNLIGLLKG